MVYLRRNPKSLSPRKATTSLLILNNVNTSCLSFLTQDPPIASPTTSPLLDCNTDTLQSIAISRRIRFISYQIFNSSSRSINYKIANEDTEYSLIGEIYQILCTQLLSILPVAVWQAPCGWLWLPCRPLFISPAGLLSRRPQ